MQLLVFAFDSIDKFSGEIRRELDALRSHGLIHVIDLLFVQKTQEGVIEAVQMVDLLDYQGVTFDRLLGATLGRGATAEEQANIDALLIEAELTEQGHGLSLEEIHAAAEDIPPGTAVALLLVEHAWAIGFGTAIRNADGRLATQGFLTRDALLAVGREVHAILEAEIEIERAEALRGAAMLDALITVDAAEAIQQAALQQAAATVVGVEAFRTVIAAEAVRALIVAGLLEEAAATEAIDVLVDAELISAAALQEAAVAADTAAQELALFRDDAASPY
jgi:uncharacterized membrane protein